MGTWNSRKKPRDSHIPTAIIQGHTYEDDINLSGPENCLDNGVHLNEQCPTIGRKKSRRLGEVKIISREDYVEFDLDARVEAIRALFNHPRPNWIQYIVNRFGRLDSEHVTT